MCAWCGSRNDACFILGDAYGRFRRLYAGSCTRLLDSCALFVCTCIVMVIFRNTSSHRVSASCIWPEYELSYLINFPSFTAVHEVFNAHAFLHNTHAHTLTHTRTSGTLKLRTHREGLFMRAESGKPKLIFCFFPSAFIYLALFVKACKCTYT